ncbi:MAG: glycerophosphodiester phosphodiesterase family protein [Chlorobium sp.]
MAFEIQAHRGARAFFPENTLQAFCHAATLGVRVLELDLVVSKDHEIVVSHDPWLSGPLCSDPEGEPLRVDERRFPLYEMPYADILRFDCGRPHPSFPLQSRIVASKPLLATVFNGVDTFMAQAGLHGNMVYNLEIKSWPVQDGLLHPSPDRYAALVVQLVVAAALASRVRIQSFDWRVVREAWKISPHLCYGLLLDDRAKMLPFLSNLGFVPQYLNPHSSLVERELFDFLHLQGIKTIPWTVNRPEEMLLMQQTGADGIITDYPEIAVPLFSSCSTQQSGH